MTLRMKSDVTMQERLKDFDPDGALRQHAREIFELLKEDIHHLPATFWNNVLERSGLKYRMSPTQIDEAIQRSQAYKSEERSVGKECVSTCRSRWSTYT